MVELIEESVPLQLQIALIGQQLSDPLRELRVEVDLLTAQTLDHVQGGICPLGKVPEPVGGKYFRKLVGVAVVVELDAYELGPHVGNSTASPADGIILLDVGVVREGIHLNVLTYFELGRVLRLVVVSLRSDCASVHCDFPLSPTHKVIRLKLTET